MRGASIIYPIWNRAGYLEKTLRGMSGFDVDWNESEILVMDDCSTDNLDETIDNYGNILNIRKIRIDSTQHPQVAGRKQPITPCFAINEGVRQSRCPQVILSCPEISPLSVSSRDALQRFINYRLLPKQAAFAFVFDQAKGGKINRLVHPAGYWPFFFFGKIRKEDWTGIGGYDEVFMAYVSHGDADLDVRMSRNGFTYLFLGEPVFVHCYHGREGFSEKSEEWKRADAFFREKNFAA